MRRRPKTDANQKAVVAALRDAKAVVLDLSGVGGGCPDLLVKHGKTVTLMEVVGPDKLKRFPPHGLSENQVEFHRVWEGAVHVVTSAEEAVNLVLGRSQGLL